jgi:ribokinase
VRAAAGAIEAAGAVLCQLETPLDATLEAFRLARARGVRTVLTPAPVQALPDELLSLTDVCVLNESEAEALVGASGGPETLAKELRRRGPGAVIVTLGARGCFLTGPSGDSAFSAPAVTAVDTTGAGDAFVGALAVKLATGYALHPAVPRAIAAAALSVTRPGAMSSYPTRAEVAAFLPGQAPGH